MNCEDGVTREGSVLISKEGATKTGSKYLAAANVENGVTLKCSGLEDDSGVGVLLQRSA